MFPQHHHYAGHVIRQEIMNASETIQAAVPASPLNKLLSQQWSQVEGAVAEMPLVPRLIVQESGALSAEKRARASVGEMGKWIYSGILEPNSFFVSFHVFDLMAGEALNVHISGFVCVCLFCFKSLGKDII